MNITIRPLVREDAYTSYRWRNIPELWIHTEFRATREITPEDELAWIEKVTIDPTSARFAILADGVYVGNIYLTNIENGTGKYHIFIGEKDYWGKGIARRASVLIIDYGKSELGLRAIVLGVMQGNGAAYHLYESLGFVRTDEKEGDFIIMRLDLADWQGDPRDKIK